LSVAAWVLNLGGMAGGLLIAPRRVFRAFVRGRRCESLYGRELAPLLDESVAALRAATGTDAPGPVRATATDAALFTAAMVGGVTVGLVSFALMTAVLPLGLLNAWRKRRHDARISANA